MVNFVATQIINIEKNYPTVDEAMNRLRLEISTLKRIGVKSAKVIHGYGSTGNGGAIRQASRLYLKKMHLDKKISGMCLGEHFGPFEKDGREMLNLDKTLRSDPDWARQNDGITVIVF